MKELTFHPPTLIVVTACPVWGPFPYNIIYIYMNCMSGRWKLSETIQVLGHFSCPLGGVVEHLLQFCDP